MEIPYFLNCGVSMFFACYIAIICLAIEGQATNNNITTDGSSLLVFKAHITSDPYQILTRNWSASTSVCNWIGITCDHDLNNRSRVAALNLTSMGLTGTIPPHIGNLSFLVALDLRDNSFHGPLPVEMVYLDRLEFIRLGYNRFHEEIPSWFGSFPQLQHLHLQFNNFTGTIPPSLCNISTLRSLGLSNNNLRGKIPEAIGDLVNLELFGIYGNQQISGSIPVTIFNISSLKTIEFANNRLSGSLPDDLCRNLPVLQTLSLHNNELVGSIPSSLRKCKELLYIYLNDNKFAGSIPTSIGKLELLEELYLESNNLEGEIPEELGSLHALQILSIGGSSALTGVIPRSLANCTSLRELQLSESSFTGSIPTEIGHLPNLVHLNLNNNSLSGHIPSSIFNHSKIEVIALFLNNLSGDLPSNLGLLVPNLEKLYLWGNELEGIIPNSISNASKLTLIDIGLNSFSGPIPITIGELRHLERLFLDYNQLTSESSTPELSFLSSLTNCKHLQTLALSNNTLDGTLPVSIGNFSALQYFQIDYCKVKGSIPQEIGNISSLLRLELGNNELTGPIPTEVGKMRTLQLLYLDGNKLQGSIPNEICHLSNLGVLYLSENKLSGSIPACLGDITSLKVLHLNSNNLTSIIPSSFWSLKDIVDVNLSANSLSGRLSSDIGSLRAVTQIDLSRNELSGDLPSSIGGLQNLINFSIAHNRFEGIIPESFGNMIGLESLDLSSNNLSGSIPKSLEKLLYLKNLNVSFNGLQGEIPTGGPFANFSAESFMPNGALCSTLLPHVPSCKTSTLRQSKITRSRILIYIFSAVASATLVVALVFLVFKRLKRNIKSLGEEDVSTVATWRRISYHELQRATDGFNESNLLGRGGFGSVYKGKLLDGMDIAVKVFNLEVERALISFDVECGVLCNIRHRNLVKIISSCSNNIDFKALILEYMPNGSLEKWLYSHNNFLDILQRLNIMIDVASALEYLHHGDTTPIVHCDLKPSNVLLDEDMVAHVSDFGISKLLGEGDSTTQTNTLATIGYMAPEYGSEGIVSVRGDVYSFGILLIETFTRKKPTENKFEGEMSLKCWVKEALSDSVTEVADVNLLGKENFAAKKDCISATLELAVDCCDELPERRIDISNALSTLKSITNKFQKSVGRT